MYSAASIVADYTPGLLEDGNFTATTTPSKTAVERFLSAGCSLIHGRLQAVGYTTPVPSTAAVYDQIVDLETLYAVSRAEMVRMTARVVAGERTRSQIFADMFNKGLDQLMKMDLSRAGVSHAATKMYAGGISESDKTSVEDDTDQVEPRFKRDQFRHSGTNRPGSVEGDSITD
jgi:hypothetical protein